MSPAVAKRPTAQPTATDAGELERPTSIKQAPPYSTAAALSCGNVDRMWTPLFYLYFIWVLFIIYLYSQESRHPYSNDLFILYTYMPI